MKIYIRANIRFYYILLSFICTIQTSTYANNSERIFDILTTTTLDTDCVILSYSNPVSKEISDPLQLETNAIKGSSSLSSKEINRLDQYFLYSTSYINQDVLLDHADISINLL